MLIAVGSAEVSSAPALALLGKEIVKSIVQSFVDDVLHSALLSTLGPCDGALISAPLTAARSALAGRGAVPILPAVPAGLPDMPSALPTVPTLPGAGAITALSNAAGAAAVADGWGTPPVGTLQRELSAQMRKSAEQDRDEVLHERRADRERRVLTPEQIEADDRGASHEPFDADRMTALLTDSKPLTAAEVDELADQYARLSMLSADSPQCSRESLRRLLAQTMVTPMAAGPIRMLMRSLREFDREMAQARTIFEAMTAQDRDDFLRHMLAQIEHWSNEERAGFASLLRTGALGVPQAVRDALLERLGR